MKPSQQSSFKRIVRAAGYSASGLRMAFLHEAAFRQEFALLAAGGLITALLPVTPMETLALIASLVLVMIVELLNSAVEAVVDRISPELHPLSGRAKDYGSAAVFLSLLLAGGVWIAVLGRLVW